MTIQPTPEAQDKPQQEPARPLDVCYNCDHHKDVHRNNGCKVCQCSGFQPPITEQQERQTGGHVHERGMPYKQRVDLLGSGHYGMVNAYHCKGCDIGRVDYWWDAFEAGLKANQADWYRNRAQLYFDMARERSDYAAKLETELAELRQAGGQHVHERGVPANNADPPTSSWCAVERCYLDRPNEWWDGYEQGVADKRRQ